MNILGVRVDNLARKEILEKVEFFLREEKFHQIATINPEFILEAQNNSEFKEILNSCDLNVADGFGIKCAFWRHGKRLKARMTGARLMMEILGIAEKNDISVFLAARSDGLSTWQETRDAILKIYPKLSVSGEDINCHPRAGLPEMHSLQAGGGLVPGHKVFTLDSRFYGNDKAIVFCNFGAPHQELFLNSQKSGTIRLAMGVGGSFDFLTGRIRRAPVLLRRAGLEWLWRIFSPQPWKFKKERLKRIFRAVVVFPVRVILNK